LADFSGEDRKILLVIILIALALRVAYVLDTRDSPYFDHPTLDSFWYDAKAKDVLAGDLLGASATFRVPLYVYFMAGVYAVFGHSFMALLLIQAVLGALACGLLYVLGKRLFGTVAGIVAGLGFALYGMAVFGSGEILPVTLLILFILGGIYFLVEALSGRGLGAGLTAGVCFGLAFLTHPDVVLLLIMVGLVAALVFRKTHGIRIVAAAGAVVICFMLLQGLRNRAISGDFYVFSPQGAVNLYIGNARYADGKTPVAPPTSHPYEIGRDPSQDSITLGCRQAAFEGTGKWFSDRELSAYYLRKTVGEIRADPSGWIGLLGRKVYYFLNSYEHSDIKLIPRFRARYSTVLKLPLVPFAFPISLGLVGAALVFARRNRFGFLMVAGLAAYAANSVIFFVLWRYRLPAVPFLMLLGGYAVSELLGAVKRRDLKVAAAIVVSAGLICLLSVSRFWNVAREGQASQYLINEAALDMGAGEYGKAIEAYTEAIQADPHNSRAYFYLGKAYATQGRIEESKDMMGRAVRITPSYEPYAFVSIGAALANQGRFEEAVDCFTRALALDPGLGLAAYDLGVSLMNLGRTAEAEKAFTEAERLCKEDMVTLVAIAGAYVKMGEADRGVSLARGVLAGEPANVEALYTVGLGLEAQGRPSEALGYFRAALRLQPGNAEIRQKIRNLGRRGLSP
jgi:cytochrome c-type biogenesis protein CcmH/NrfG